jgi:membrane protease YdiL (CAAX protease family)
LAAIEATMSAVAARLSDSAFIADLSPRERSLWRVIATVIAGLVSGFLIGLAAGAVALFLIAAAMGAFGGGFSSLPHRISEVMSANGASMTSAIVLLVLATATNCPMAATFLGIAALISGRSILRYITLAPAYRWRLTLLGIGLSCLVIGPVVALGQLTDPHAPAAPVLSLGATVIDRALYATACVLLLIPAAAAEEVVFRGWLLRQSATLSRNPFFLMAVNGVLFSAVHGEFAPDPFLTRALMGAGFVYMTLRLRGVEFSVGAHAANNILIVLFIQPLSLKPSPSTGLTGASLFQDLFLFFSYVVMTEIVARWAPLRRWSGADQDLPPSSAVAAHFS